MANFEEIRDPIVRIYAIELANKIETTLLRATTVFYSARRSLQNNRRIPEGEIGTAYQRYYNIELAYRRFLPHMPADGLKASLDQIDSAHLSLSEAMSYFRSSREHFQRYTNVDHNLRSFNDELLIIEKEIDLLQGATLHSNDEARKEIYERVLGEKLDQLDAPYLFEIINYIVELTNTPAVEASASAGEGLALLVKEANDLAKSLVQTNVDRRFLSAINEYIGALTESNFSPIKVDLFSNRLRFYLVEMKDELPGFAIAEVSALLLSQERVLRQFPTWRAFETTHRDLPRMNRPL
jgi:hypothetical protein